MTDKSTVSEKQITVSGIRNLATSHGYLLRKLHNMRGAYLLYDPLGESVIGNLTVLYEDLKSWIEKSDSDHQRKERLVALSKRIYPFPSGLHKLIANLVIIDDPGQNPADKTLTTVEAWYDAAF